MGEKSPFSVAIIGGGLTGLSLLVGLLKRDIDAKIYEQASSFTEIGAGVSLSPNAVRAMEELHPGIYEAFDKVVLRVTSCQAPDVYFDWINAYHKGERGDEWLFDIRQDRYPKGQPCVECVLDFDPDHPEQTRRVAGCIEQSFSKK